MMRILGIDPGLDTTGYGIIEDDTFKVVEAGVIKTGARTPIHARLKKIFDSLSNIINEHKPDVLVLEKIYSHYRHPATAILMGHARGVACLISGLYDVKLVSYPSTRIKKALTGNGMASKIQMQRMVRNFLNLKDLPDPTDISDALAMAIGYCFIEKNIGEEIVNEDRRRSGAYRRRFGHNSGERGFGMYERRLSRNYLR